MPHDANGELLTAGDKIWIPATIKLVVEGEYCTTEVEFDIIMRGTDRKSSNWFNANQVVKDPTNVTFDPTRLVTHGVPI